MDIAAEYRERFKELMLDCCGHHFEGERERALIDAVGQRMGQLKIAAAGDYCALLPKEREELQRLIELLTVKETYFFREAEYLRLVVDRLIPELQREGRREPVRIFCAGCATGEEPYSLAMLLEQRFGAESRTLFQIAAGDIDASAIANARRGIYGQSSFRGDHVECRQRYFTPHGPDSWRLGEEIRGLVHFEVLNLLVDSSPALFQRPDIIFYRNVSIYFPGEVQKEIFGRLASRLATGGALFVGAAETMHHNLGILPLVEQDSLFYFRKGKLAQAAAPPRIPGPAAPRSPSNTFSLSSRRIIGSGKRSAKFVSDQVAPRDCVQPRLFSEALALARNQRLKEALELLERIITTDNSLGKAYALKGCILAEMERFTEAQQQGRIALRHDPLCLEACLLLGVGSRHLGDNAEAGRRFREALYVNRACWPAHFYLAEIAYGQGDLGRARRGYRSTLKVLTDRNYSVAGEGFFPLSYNPEHLIRVCRHKLHLIGGTTK